MKDINAVVKNGNSKIRVILRTTSDNLKDIENKPSYEDDVIIPTMQHSINNPSEDDDTDDESDESRTPFLGSFTR
jgi:hypothetical protein